MGPEEGREGSGLPSESLWMVPVALLRSTEPGKAEPRIFEWKLQLLGAHLAPILRYARPSPTCFSLEAPALRFLLFLL